MSQSTYYLLSETQCWQNNKNILSVLQSIKKSFKTQKNKIY